MINKSKGNMYEFVTHTWNPIKGKCFHDCSYCYMKRWGEQKPLRLSEKDLKDDLGENNKIFVGSSTDMFAKDVPPVWIERVLRKCSEHENEYLFQTKNPEILFRYKQYIPKNSVICVTLESDMYRSEIMKEAPSPTSRVDAINLFNYSKEYSIMITIEPVMDFQADRFIDMIKRCSPFQVNIGADSGNSNLPEPSDIKVLYLISELEKFTKVVRKKNLSRILK